jgi:hypothetical protein
MSLKHTKLLRIFNAVQEAIRKSRRSSDPEKQKFAAEIQKAWTEATKMHKSLPKRTHKALRTILFWQFKKACKNPVNA